MMDIDASLVKSLIAEQFPQWRRLAVRPVVRPGWDNRSFRVGHKLLVRLPSAAAYAPQVDREQRWLPFLRQHLSFAIPEPMAMGQAGCGYPWPWSVTAGSRGRPWPIEHHRMARLSRLHSRNAWRNFKPCLLPTAPSPARRTSIAVLHCASTTRSLARRSRRCTAASTSRWPNALGTAPPPRSGHCPPSGCTVTLRRAIYFCAVVSLPP